MTSITVYCFTITCFLSGALKTVSTSSDNYGNLKGNGNDKVPMSPHLERQQRSLTEQDLEDYEDIIPIKTNGKLLSINKKGRIAEFIPRLGRRSVEDPVDSPPINSKILEELEESKQYALKRKPIYYVIPRLGKRLSSYSSSVM